MKKLKLTSWLLLACTIFTFSLALFSAVCDSHACNHDYQPASLSTSDDPLDDPDGTFHLHLNYHTHEKISISHLDTTPIKFSLNLKTEATVIRPATSNLLSRASPY